MPADTSSVTVEPGFSFTRAFGSCPMSDPAGTSELICGSSCGRSPALPRALIASPSLRPVTSGTATSVGTGGVVVVPVDVDVDVGRRGRDRQRWGQRHRNRAAAWRPRAGERNLARDRSARRAVRRDLPELQPGSAQLRDRAIDREPDDRGNEPPGTSDRERQGDRRARGHHAFPRPATARSRCPAAGRCAAAGVPLPSTGRPGAGGRRRSRASCCPARRERRLAEAAARESSRRPA